jgi:PAS domain-containing protein
MSEVNSREYSTLFGEKNNNAEMFLKKFIETLPVILFVFQPDSDKLLYVNEKFSKVLGYTLEDINIRNNMLPNLMQIDNISLPDHLFAKPTETTQWYNYKGNFLARTAIRIALIFRAYILNSSWIQRPLPYYLWDPKFQDHIPHLNLTLCTNMRYSRL